MEDEAEGLGTGGVVVIVSLAEEGVAAADAFGDGAAAADPVAGAAAEEGCGEGSGDFFSPARSGDGGTGTPSCKLSSASCTRQHMKDNDRKLTVKRKR